MNLLNNHKFRQITFWIFFTIFLVLLAGFAYKGIFSRYLQDDYCYGSTIREQGFFKGVIYPYFHRTEYNGNRYTLTLFSGFAEILLGTKRQSWFALISILGWLGSLTFLVSQIMEKVKKRYHPFFSLVLASIILSFTLYLAPDIYQSLYWRSSSLPYLTPLVFVTFTMAWIIYQSKKQKTSWFIYPIFFLVSFIAAGFSETAAVFQVAVFSLLLILNNTLFKVRNELSINHGFILVSLSGSLIGALLLAISPTNAASLAGSSVKMAGFVALITKSFRFGFDFLNYSLTGKWLPFIVLFLFGFFLMQFNLGKNSSFKTWLYRVILIVFCTYLVSVACMTPSVLVRSAYPDPRALILPHFALINLIFLLGVFTGEFLPITILLKSNKILINLTLTLSMLGMAVYSARMIPLIMSDISPLRARATAWDQRQELIYQEKAAGVTHIIVPAFDNIDHINELHLEEDHWVNQCAARYYRVEGISAVENYNGVKPYFK